MPDGIGIDTRIQQMDSIGGFGKIALSRFLIKSPYLNEIMPPFQPSRCYQVIAVGQILIDQIRIGQHVKTLLQTIDVEVMILRQRRIQSGNAGAADHIHRIARNFSQKGTLEHIPVQRRVATNAGKENRQNIRICFG